MLTMQAPPRMGFTADQATLALHLLSRLREADARLAGIEARLYALVAPPPRACRHGAGRRRRR